MLQRELHDAGVEVEFPPPVERRGAGQQAVHVTMTIVGWGGGVVGGAAWEAAKRVCEKFREKHRGQLSVEVEEDS